MEQQVLELLRATQLSAAQPRTAAEMQLKELHANEAFPAALATIGAHTDIAVSERLAALLSLKAFVNECWSPSLDDFAGKVQLGDAAKAELRRRLLSIVFADQLDSKITATTAAVVALIAKSDFPEEWPELLDNLLGRVQQRVNDDQTQAILVVLAELISSGLDEDQFYRYAVALVDCLRGIATDGSKRLTVRAHAVHTFRSCFDFVENLRERDDQAIRSFTKSVCDSWAEFFLSVVKEPMPTFPTAAEEDDQSDTGVGAAWRGVVCLKIQVIVTLARIQGIFPDIMAAQDFFNACWDSIQAHGPPYYASFVDGEREGGKINNYQMPYTFDFLIIEEIDYLQALLEAPLVKQQLDGMIATDTASNGTSVINWLSSVLGTLITFSSITREAEEMWDMDFNVFLSEETFAETNNSPRSVCAGFVWKICNWFPKQTIESLLGHVRTIFDDVNSNWRHKEAALFTLLQVAEEHENENRLAEPDAVKLCIDYTRVAITDGQHFLRARGHITMASVLVAWMERPGINYETVLGYAYQSLDALDHDDSDVVKTACIRIMRDYLTALPSPQGTELQPKVIDAIARFLDTLDFSKDIDENVDLVDVVLQTLRDAIMANPLTCLDHNALDVLLTMVKYGAARDDHSSILIDEAFESAAEAMAKQGGDSYSRLCRKVLPSLVAAFDIEDPRTKQKTALTDVSLSILKILTEQAVEPLPSGFVTASMPRLCRIIFADVDFFVRQSATLTIKHLLMNDKDQVFNWVDPELSKNGLQMCFLVIGHLLGPQVDDASAAEVGELAVSVVEKAGAAVLGPSMHELLQVLAVRLSTAEHPGLIQSLTLVFARLSLLNVSDVLSFLSGLSIQDPSAGNQTVSGLDIVLRKWLENTCHFVGFDAIRQNISALVALYQAHDPRVEAITCNGDLIPDTSSRIKTRSMAKKAPIRYTQVSAPLKIVKVLVAELLPYGDPNDVFANPLKSPVGTIHSVGSGGGGGGGKAGGSSDGSWESDDEEGLGGGAFNKQADDATQAFLIEFFRAEGADPRFQEIYNQLTPEERKRCVDTVDNWSKMESQQNLLAQTHSQP